MENSSSPVTLADIARQCGVSKATVSRALHGHPKTAQETIEHVRRVAQELGYDPSRHITARRLALSKTGKSVLSDAFGLMFPHKDFVRTNYFTYIFQGVVDAVTEEDYQIQTVDSRHMGQANTIPPAYRRGELDGLLTLSTQTRDWEIALGLLRADSGFGNRPIVGVVEHLEGCSAAYADHFDTGYKAMKHLLDLGHRHVMLTAQYLPSGSAVHELRSAGYQKAYEEMGMDAANYLHPSYWHPNDVEWSKNTLVREIARHPEVTALVARNDLEAIIMYGALVQAGISVPEDLSFISFDGTDSIIDSKGASILTTVRLPLDEIAYEGAKLLIRRIRGEETDDKDVVLPVELIIHSSTAPPRSK